jgi:6,7-dimethyl-8-ribityllumazine synthase
MKKNRKNKSTKEAGRKIKIGEIKIGIVTALFNSEITERLEAGALATLEQAGVQTIAVQVPGAIEIPLACQALLLEGDCDGVIALGAVIRGETSHYDYVCNSVERGITQLMLATRRPIGFGVLTTENEEQAMARVGGIHGHKGIETAQVVLKMIDLLRNIKNHQITSQQIPQQEVRKPKKPKRNQKTKK